MSLLDIFVWCSIALIALFSFLNAFTEVLLPKRLRRHRARGRAALGQTSTAPRKDVLDSPAER
jgi:hypothetical protein